ncbi:MAG TPA: glucosidase [Aliidongia sp.]|uniref:MGH1-like glycoside hydrolase domain-containing protein n=1 Tax=Aliidongia sp. TaxID=1914230 RepID=UPI002DDD2D67|nr:glucosidase [Aliidongia sp.]HEV2673007.1 glucosidase [Aliidongia sp.]
MTAEQDRLDAAVRGEAKWRRWGPYVSERQWGTVREDYSSGGTAWDYLPHDHARSHAYRWGEDGLAGFGDEKLHWCLGLALWNGQDPILKERLFGLTNSEGNHGEDVKELYYYLDGTPTHSYMRMLYKYPQRAFPYGDLVAENRRRGNGAPEYELIDTGVFADRCYFDVTIEYAKADVDDILMQITIENRADVPATLSVLPHLWARNTWSWSAGSERPVLMAMPDGSVAAHYPKSTSLRLSIDQVDELLFCENETNTRRLFGTDAQGFFKDGINDYVVSGDRGAINPLRQGTKCAALTKLTVPALGARRVRLRLRPEGQAKDPFKDFARLFAKRKVEADEFYEALQSGIADPDARLVQRQALAGLLWSKQFYHIDVPRWLAGDPTQPAPPAERKHGRNSEWMHLNNADIVSMPDKWEYPWYAAWDLAFHCVTFALIDPEFAKSQLVLLTREWYMHPNGQLPAYEWAFGDVNPPVHAWAAWRVYEMDKAQQGVGDRAFLERVFHKLMLNFTWWVNRKDAGGRNIFQGGFLGLDNIGLFDRSAPLPTGGTINQSDGTAWMAMYSLNLMRIAIELAEDNHVYEDIATKFFEHFLYIAEAMTNIGGDGMGLWDEQDQFFYDVLKLPGGASVPLRVRSMVGLIPIYAVEVIDSSIFEKLPAFSRRLRWFLNHRPDLAALVSRWTEPGMGERRLLSLLRGHRLKALLRRMLDETEFLSDHGIRAVSKYHEGHPLEFEHNGQHFGVSYTPGESTSGLFGGNSNWRGPIWMPVNYLLIESLRSFHSYYGDDFRVECPAGSGNLLHLGQIAEELAVRLSRLFLRGEDGRRPVLGDNSTIQADPAFRDHVLFYEYFHGDTGRGVGASHQTGWTALVALLLQAYPQAPALDEPAETEPSADKEREHV